jgi:phosphoribosylformylglycinamidine synthase PurS subunit
VKSVPIATLITDACAKLLSNQASLPSMPAVAARIHDAMASPNWSMRTIATIIKSDLGTTTYLLQVANSPLYAGSAPTRQVEQAIAREALRLALDQHKELAVGLKGVQQERSVSDAFEQTASGQSLIDMFTLDLIIGSGGILSHAPRRAQSMTSLMLCPSPPHPRLNTSALGYTNVSAVRIGKSIRLVVDAHTEAAARAQVEEMCERILANPVIEAYTITLQVLAEA